MSRKVYLILIVWFVGISALISVNKINASELPSSIPEFHLKDKVINESDKKGTLSYGPYKRVKKGNYIIGIHYNAEIDGNSYKITQELGQKEIISKQLKTGRDWEIIYINFEEEGAAEVVTYYNGKGLLGVYSLYIISIHTFWLLCLILVGMSIILWMLLKYRIVIITKFSIAFVTGSVIFCYLNNYSILAIIIGVYLFLGYYIFVTLRKQGNVEIPFYLAIDLIALSILELLNKYYYDFLPIHTTIFSFLIFINIYTAYYFIMKTFKFKYLIIKIVTIIIIFYASSQYVYYSFFRDFYRLKVVFLAKTAVDVTQSLTELISRYPAKCFCVNLILYMCICIEIVLLNLYKKNKK